MTISPSVTTIIIGQTATLTASGADSYTWHTGSNQSSIDVTPTQQTSYTVSGSRNGCVGQATATVTTTCTNASAQAISTTVFSELGPGNCSVKITGSGFGTSMIVTGPDNYVYSSVYRRAGTYTTTANVTKPGTYTFTVQNKNACGDVFTDTRTFLVTGTACQ
ncbi:hypothetical protein BLX24_28140 [Arsenicibacter rosenii]|uniref:IPT/TIG domain-containing protein n=1 Tax=Arsenicibacter rosenii TaxID=1750698 RepID=A0A1S2VBV8_9BACT|nr:hypothetical protein BLX24_28140 [Arsenicibacter rosenii]